MKPGKFIADLLQEKGKYSRKNVAGSVAFLFAMVYVVLGGVLDYEPKEFVFNGFMLFAAAALGLTLINKMQMFNNKEKPPVNNAEN